MSGAFIRVNVGQYVWYIPSVCGTILCVFTGLNGPGPIATVGAI